MSVGEECVGDQWRYASRDIVMMGERPTGERPYDNNNNTQLVRFR